MFEISRSLNLTEQISFSEISGYYNQIYLDKLSTERSIYKGIIIHGMYLVLWALNEKLNDLNSIYLSKININFLNGVLFNNKVNCISKNDKENFREK